MVALDLPTLMLVGAFVSVICAAVFALTWWQGHQTSAPLWWAGGILSLGLGVASLAFAFVGGLAPLFLVGLSFIILSPALTWSGMRAFRRRRVYPLLVAAGPFGWLIAAAALHAAGADWVLPIVNTLFVIAYQGAVALELKGLSEEDLRTRKPLLALVAIHTAMSLLAVQAALSGNSSSLKLPPLNSLFGLIHFETIIYVIGMTFFLLAMKKERAERQLIRDALTDSLTGLANRRAFKEMAERVAARCKQGSEPLTVAIFDLDHFKAVNDTFGHAFGDEVLRVFAKAARGALRPGDILSRVGGEEFFAVLPGATLKDGCATADRVRRAFADTALCIDGKDVQATVSAGVIASSDAHIPLPTLIEKADAALYRAKLGGRNRVEHGEERPPGQRPHLVRVA